MRKFAFAFMNSRYPSMRFDQALADVLQLFRLRGPHFMKNIFAIFTVLAYTMNAHALLIQPIRSNEVADFELSLQIAAKSHKHKRAWAKLKASQKMSAVALKKSPSLPLALETDAQKREIAAFERKLKEAFQFQAATASPVSASSVPESNSENTLSSSSGEIIASIPEAPELPANSPVENLASSTQEQASLAPLPEPPAFEPPVVASEPPVIVNERANEHANNNAQNNSTTESNSQNNSSNGNSNSSAGGNSDSSSKDSSTKDNGKKK